MKNKKQLEDIKNKIKELSTYKETDKEIVRKLCTDKNKKIIEYDELYAVENVLNELERLQKENKNYGQKNINLELERIISHLMFIESMIGIQSGLSKKDTSTLLEKIEKIIDELLQNKESLLKKSNINKGEKHGKKI